MATKPKGNKMSTLSKITKVGEAFTVNRYDNGYMVEIGGQNDDGEWKNCKVMCSSREELFAVINEALDLEKED